jgi:superfamily I DNA/RNA helicase
MEMRLPTWDELIAEQLDVMEHSLNKPLFVAGPPGSGKTVLAVRRAEAASAEGQTVALVTYNRMLRRLATLLTAGSAVAHTMHKFAYHDYRNRTGTPPASKGRSSYEYDWPSMLATLCGHANSEATWDHVVVDEGQDLPAGFFEYLYKHATSILTVFADEDQALGDRRTTLTQIRVAACLPKPILLHENHRNCPEIAALAEHFHSGGLPTATPRRATVGQRPRLIRKPAMRDTVELIATWLENRGGTVGVIVRGNQTGGDIHGALTTRLPERRVDFYTWGTNNEDAIALLDEGVTILNKESVKGQEFDTVFLLELEEFIPCTSDVMMRAMYMMCARARDYLFLVHKTRLSAAAVAALPGHDILERG